ncbi:hypothetical protein ACFO3J_31130 [Streptomyces polygonati]|uniref:Uncharacterized protein n=1 Tax=Streptomyces polygonati TaxID=1617087 RepID=A0ABV8HY98_9ACTN
MRPTVSATVGPSNLVGATGQAGHPTALIAEAQRAAAGLNISTHSGHPPALTAAQVAVYQLGICRVLGGTGAGLR